MIYLDYAATAPMTQPALDAYLATARRVYGNAGSLHDAGGLAEETLDWSRETLAAQLRTDKRCCYLTGSGSEANGLALHVLAHARRDRGNHLIVSDAEHASVRGIATYLGTLGFDVSVAPVDGRGRVDPAGLEKLLRPETILASVAFVNSETGTIQPLEEIAALLRPRGIPLHSDGVQAFGKLPLAPEALGIQALSVSAHKIGGPKGMGLLYIDPSLRWSPIIPGTTQERGMRFGTVDVPGAVAFAVAAEAACKRMADESSRLRGLQKRFIEEVRALGVRFELEGHETARAPHILGIRVPGIQGQELMLALNARGVAVSTGSACRVGLSGPSRTLLAMGRSEEEARELVRFSFGAGTTERQASEAAAALRASVAEAFSQRGGGSGRAAMPDER